MDSFVVGNEMSAGMPDSQTASRLVKGRTSFVVPLFIISLIIPLFFYIGPLRLAPFLIILLVMFIPLFFIWISGGANGVVLPDILILLYCMWSSLSLVVIHGAEFTIEPGGLLFLQTFGAYLLGRVFIKNVQALRSVILTAGFVLTFIFPFAIIETLTSRAVFMQLFSKLGPVYASTNMEPRWGLARVQGAFEHPILFGVFSASLFAMVFYGLRGTKLKNLRYIFLPVIVISTFVSLSTGALLCLVVQGGMIAWDWIFRTDPKRWRNLIVLCIVAYVVIDLLSNRTPFNVFVDYMTFNSGTAYNRILIWQFGIAEVWRHPLFGIGMNDWVRPYWMSASMDNFWLLNTVRYGIPAFLMMSFSFLLILVRAGNSKIQDQGENDLRRGLIISLVGVFVAICSVHLWSASFSWIMFLIGCLALFFNSNGRTGESNVESDKTNDSAIVENHYAPNIS